MKRHLKEITAEIGNGTVWLNQYTPGTSRTAYGNGNTGKESGNEWVPYSRATRVSPSSKKMIKDIVNSLSPQEKEMLKPYTPEPTPDIQTFGDRAVVSFPNGKQKSVRI